MSIVNKLTEKTIFDYIMNVLIKEGGEGHYIRFENKKEKELFSKYMWKCYLNYIKTVEMTNIIEIEKYKKDHTDYDTELDSLLIKNSFNNERCMELCLFYDATNSPHGEFSMYEIDSKNHWLIRIGDGINFKNSSEFNIWGVKRPPNGGDVKGFENLVKTGDILWFILGNSNGLVLAFAEYIKHKEIDPSTRFKRYAELGWKNSNGSCNWNIEIEYKNLTYPTTTNLFTHIKGNSVNIRKYDRNNNEKCRIDLIQIYNDMVDQNK